MCESKVYIHGREGKKLVMNDAAKIVVGDKIEIYGVFGNLKEVDGCEIDIIDLMKHEIVLKKNGGMKETINKCMICGKELKKEDITEEVCATNCGVDVVVFCRECHDLEYGS